MKQSILLGLVLVFFISCQEKKAERYTQASPEIETFKAVIADYEAGNWKGYLSHYADTAKIFQNSRDSITPMQSVEILKENISKYASYGFMKEEGDSEMVVTDKNDTWVNYWGVWQGTLSGNNQVLEMPVHLTAQFVGGKIVRQYGYYDRTPILDVLKAMEAETKANQESNTMEN